MKYTAEQIERAFNRLNILLDLAPSHSNKFFQFLEEEVKLDL